MLFLYISMLDKQRQQTTLNEDTKRKCSPVALLVVGGRIIPSLLVDRAGVQEVLVEMIHKLKHIPLHAPADANVVNQAKVDDILAQADAARVWAHGDAELGRHEEHREDFRHAGETARVDLYNVDCFGLQQLLEDHAVVCVLARRDANPVGLERLTDRGMPEDVVRCGWLLDEPE